ncbi:Helix-turn-helix [Chryseobacterium wanjuense]|uniref:Helix-turn-helix n=2 Tax=Chryseobacterium wanjuense TaxID=356305 RepID=A0A1I0S4E5_9FLAO|nr:Helix-turn-helix [Chryseobacterium wanjuense]
MVFILTRYTINFLTVDYFMKSITFGKRLTEVRKDKKMSQDEVGKLVNVHGAVIGRYEREEVKPSIEVVIQLAEVLEISLDYLVGSTDVLLEKNIVSKILDIKNCRKLPNLQKKTRITFF